MDDDTHTKLDKIVEKLDVIQEDTKGGFKMLHDRADREIGDRHSILEQIWAKIYAVEQAIVSLFRGRG